MQKLAGMAPTLEPPKYTFREIYNVPFRGSLKPTLDPLHIGPLKFTNPPPVHEFVDDQLVQSVNLPNGATSGALGGVYVTGRQASLTKLPTPPFDTRAPFMLQGIYRAPTGPTTGAWAVGILAAGGPADADQVVATLQFNTGPMGVSVPGTARLNLPLGAQGHIPQPLPAGVYNEILNGKYFTLALFIDRFSGTGSANLTVLDALPIPPPFPPPAADPSFSIPTFTLKDFAESSPLSITTVGTVIANDSAYGANVSVNVADFRIYMVGQSVL